MSDLKLHIVAMDPDDPSIHTEPLLATSVEWTVVQRIDYGDVKVQGRWVAPDGTQMGVTLDATLERR